MASPASSSETRASGYATPWTTRSTKLGADLALHIGHNAVVEEIGDFTHLIDAKDDVKFDAVIEKSIPMLQAVQADRARDLQPAPRRAGAGEEAA